MASDEEIVLHDDSFEEEHSTFTIEEDDDEENGNYIVSQESDEDQDDELLLMDKDDDMGGGSGGDSSSQRNTAADPDYSVDEVTDESLDAIKARVKEMEEEAEKLKVLQTEVHRQMNGSTTGSNSTNSGQQAGGTTEASGETPFLSLEEKVEIDSRSIYVGNVDYGATAEEIEAHFHGCGSITRVTILCNKFDGHPKGFAYVEFTDPESVNTAMAMDESLFRGRLIKVMPKRTNRPGMTERRGGGGRGGRGSRGRGGERGSYRGGASRFPRRGAYRGRSSAAFYSPY